MLAYCHVPKVASSAWMLTFADMNLVPVGTILQKFKSRSLHDHMWATFSVKMTKPGDISNLSKLYKFVIVRHPFERLVSAFHDKFVVIQQVNLMVPFIDYYVGLKGIKKPKTLRKKWINNYVDVSFKSFVGFVLHEASLSSKISGPSGHWWPFTDFCKLCEIKYNYVGKLETLKQDVDCILAAFPEYELLHRMKTRIKVKVNASGHHNKNMTIDYFTQLSRKTIDKLYSMYEADFALGGYEYPQKYIHAGRLDTES